MLSKLKKLISEDEQGYKKILIKKYNVSNFLSEKQVVIFGAGELGRLYIDIFKRNKIKVVAACDNDPNKFGSFLKGIKIISISQLRDHYKNIPIVITSKYDEEIFKQLKNSGFKKVHSFLALTLLYPKKFSNPFWNIEIDTAFKNKENIIKSLLLYKDKTSQETYLNILKYRIFLKRKYLEDVRISKEKAYFDKSLMKLSDNESFIDGGSYTGDTILEFLKATRNKYESIFAFEPDKESIKKLKKEIKSVDSHKIKVYPYGLGIKNCQVSFANDGGLGGSRITKEGKLSIKIVKADEILKNKKITLIKLDVEGSELNALKGMKGIITKYKPKLAITVYHKPPDIWEIPLYIKKLVPSYKLYLRHYGHFTFDTICYAI